MFITKLINTLYILNIAPDNPLETITKVSKTERNIIHNLTIQINNIIKGIYIVQLSTPQNPEKTPTPLW